MTEVAGVAEARTRQQMVGGLRAEWKLDGGRGSR